MPITDEIDGPMNLTEPPYDKLGDAIPTTGAPVSSPAWIARPT